MFVGVGVGDTADVPALQDNATSVAVDVLLEICVDVVVSDSSLPLIISSTCTYLDNLLPLVKVALTPKTGRVRPFVSLLRSKDTL